MYTAYAVAYYAGNYLFTQKDSSFFCVTDTGFNTPHYLAIKGHGNQEWMAPLVTSQYEGKKDDARFYVLERPEHTLYTLSFQGNGKRKQVEDFKKCKVITDIRYVFKTADNEYCGALDYDSCNFFTYNSKSGKYKIFNHPTECQLNVEGQGLQQLSQTLACYNSKRKLVAISYFSFPMIVIRNTDGTIKKCIQIGSKWPRYNKKNLEDTHEYFLDICSDDKYIYALYDDPRKEKEVSVLVFNWDAQPVARFHIARAIAFTVNSDAHTIVAINEDDSHGQLTIYKFLLPSNASLQK